MLEMIRRQGMLHPIDEMPIVIDTAAIPADFLEHVRDGGDAADAWCERIAADAVRVAPDYRREALAGLADAGRSLVSGELWHA